MPVNAAQIVARFAPSANEAYRQAFADPGGLLGQYEITTPLRLAHFMAQCMHETGGLTILVEKGNYTAENLADMWDNGNWHRYFPDKAACVAMAQYAPIDHGVTLFSLVYSNRMGNGSPDTQDGWTYRGRGILQTTGRESYREFGERFGLPFEEQPELIISPEHALKPALAEWAANHLNGAADHNDIKVITQGINGGQVGLASRKAWFAKIWPFVIGAPPVEHSVEWRVQAELDRLGYDSGEPDGVVGSRTRSAILKYRAAKGLAATPAITSDLLLSLELPGVAHAAPTPA